MVESLIKQMQQILSNGIGYYVYHECHRVLLDVRKIIHFIYDNLILAYLSFHSIRAISQRKICISAMWNCLSVTRVI